MIERHEQNESALTTEETELMQVFRQISDEKGRKAAIAYLSVLAKPYPSPPRMPAVLILDHGGEE